MNQKELLLLKLPELQGLPEYSGDYRIGLKIAPNLQTWTQLAVKEGKYNWKLLAGSYLHYVATIMPGEIVEINVIRTNEPHDPLVKLVAFGSATLHQNYPILAINFLYPRNVFSAASEYSGPVITKFLRPIIPMHQNPNKDGWLSFGHGDIVYKDIALRMFPALAKPSDDCLFYARVFNS